MDVIEVVREGIRSKLFALSFCIGVSKDQLTFEYFNWTIENVISRTFTGEALFCHSLKPLGWNDASSFSKQKMNYGRRKRN